eukprot:4387915-Prymnesium_polylepis.2
MGSMGACARLRIPLCARSLVVLVPPSSLVHIEGRDAVLRRGRRLRQKSRARAVRTVAGFERLELERVVRVALDCECADRPSPLERVRVEAGIEEVRQKAAAAHRLVAVVEEAHLLPDCVRAYPHRESARARHAHTAAGRLPGAASQGLRTAWRWDCEVGS